MRVLEKISEREVLHVNEFEGTRIEVALRLIAVHLAKHLDLLDLCERDFVARWSS